MKPGLFLLAGVIVAAGLTLGVISSRNPGGDPISAMLPNPLSCGNEHAVADAVGQGGDKLLELTQIKDTYWDKTYATQYCEGRAITGQGGAEVVSYRLHRSSDGGLIVEVEPGSDAFAIAEARQVGVSPQDLEAKLRQELGRQP